MPLRHEIQKNTYRDSVALMQVAAELEGVDGVDQATLLMATDTNLDLANNAGLLAAGADIGAGPNDLLIAIRAQDEATLDDAFALVQERLKDRISKGDGPNVVAEPTSLERALAENPQSTLALISCPGDYAAAEAMKALRLGLDVMMFSDNVALSDEIELKIYARDHDLMMMGPDCGTAIINGVPLGFANVAQSGPVGIVAASGTGLQQVVCLLDQDNVGISQAIGTGGRDLSADVGGVTMIQGLHALAADDATRVIVLISKPPHPDVARTIIAEAAACAKPVVINFLGLAETGTEADGVYFAPTLEKTARLAAIVAQKEAPPADLSDPEIPTAELPGSMGAAQQFLRGLYSGGTFCYEAQVLLGDGIGQIWSSTPVRGGSSLPDPAQSQGHTIIDLGDDGYTQGRAHPMIDQRTRVERLMQEAADPTTAVILFDLVLGFGAHPDPASEMVAAIAEARTLAQNNGREICFVGFVCGTEGDPQSLSNQRAKLMDAGVILADSNAAAVATAANLIGQIRQPNATASTGDYQ